MEVVGQFKQESRRAEELNRELAARQEEAAEWKEIK